MMMTRSSGSGRRRLVKESSSSKGKTFDQERSAMDPIDVEPLSLASPTTLVPYGTYEDDTPTTDAPELKENSPIESQNIKSLALVDNPVRTLPEIMAFDTKTKEDTPG